jgi:hypothetical protein
VETQVVLRVKALERGEYGIEFTVEEDTGKKVHALPVTPPDRFPDRATAVEDGKRVVQTYMLQNLGQEPDAYEIVVK